MEMAAFTRKLNHIKGKTYPVEEIIEMPESGTYEGMLQHDNVDEATLRVYTGPGMTGNLIQAFALSTPTLSPWKREIRIHATEPTVYVCYETDGDTVEAEDVNLLQDEVARMQAEASAQERRLGDVKEGMEKSVQELRESYQEITEQEIDLLDEVVPEGGTGELSGLKEGSGRDGVVKIEGESAMPVPRGLVRYLSYKGLQHLYGRILARISKKVDKAEGKGLSTNDFTTVMKNKLDGIADRANLYIHPVTPGSRHIPAGGSAGDILRGDGDGRAHWEAFEPYEHDHDDAYLKKNAVTWADLAERAGEDAPGSEGEDTAGGGGGE